jgi:hypothetical protein
MWQGLHRYMVACVHGQRGLHCEFDIELVSGSSGFAALLRCILYVLVVIISCRR